MSVLCRIGFCLIAASLAVAENSAFAQLAPHAPTPSLIRGGLVQAQFQAKKDRLGFTWDVISTGRLHHGSNRVFNGCCHLQVNGSAFTAANTNGQKMSRDGSECFLSQEVSGIQITRRIKVDVAHSNIRYVEIFDNPTSRAIPIQITLGTTLLMPAQAVLTDKARVAPMSVPSGTSIVAAGETGIVAYHPQAAISPYGQQPSVLFYLAGQGAQVRPMFKSVADKKSFVFFYQFSVPSKKRVAIIHGVAQRHFNSVPTRPTLDKTFQVFRSSRWTDDLPADLRECIVNGQTSSDQPTVDVLKPTTELASAWGVERGESDILVFDQTTHVAGRLAGKSLTIHTELGDASVPIGEVAAILGGNGEGRPTRVHLRSGEILVGPLQFEALRFNSDADLQFELRPEQLNVLLARTNAQPSTPERHAGDALLQTRRGDRIALSKWDGVQFPLVTPFGTLSVPLEDVRTASIVDRPQPHYRFIFRNGSRLAAILRFKELSLETRRFGNRKLGSTLLADFTQREGIPEMADNERPPQLNLSGDNVLVGTLDVPKIGVSTAAGQTTLPASEIREMTRGEASGVAGAAFLFVMADGSEFQGRLLPSVLPIRSLGRQWQIPVSHIVAYTQPDPRHALVRKLAAEYEELPDATVAERLVQRAIDDVDVVQRSLLRLQRSRADAVVKAIFKSNPKLGEHLVQGLKDAREAQNRQNDEKVDDSGNSIPAPQIEPPRVTPPTSIDPFGGAPSGPDPFGSP